MPLKTSLFITAICFTLVAAVSGSLRANSGPLWRSSGVAASVATGSGPAAQAEVSSDRSLNRAAHSDESVQETLNQKFSVENSRVRMQQIDAALTSFRQLTETSQKNLGQAEVAGVGNTDWETQNLGFHNWVGAVEGTILKQNARIAQLELELAQQQHADKKITKVELTQKAVNAQKAAQEFDQFWKSFSIAD
ncbi:hypothetical protein H6F90_14190 [Trichocoleus sp. FACHB-591]|uniref:hypothetical protein n=1 Tax=Trichocoleus sp. FACHB-591 TaxID=2692872 RepID=UPI0016888378|nr:hypothetical protein [Trichocoleus sp. FACHB-591]MBD2096290.1 hypothetical protein [Trichocoleus sp. FACHB-591]